MKETTGRVLEMVDLIRNGIENGEGPTGYFRWSAVEPLLEDGEIEIDVDLTLVDADGVPDFFIRLPGKFEADREETTTDPVYKAARELLDILDGDRSPTYSDGSYAPEVRAAIDELDDALGER